MKHPIKKVLSLLMALAMVVSCLAMADLSVTAAALSSETVTIVTASDLQNPDGDDTTNVQAILDQMSTDTQDADALFFCGDYDVGWLDAAGTQAKKEGFDQLVKASGVVADDAQTVYVQGNHDSSEGIGSFLSSSGNNDPAGGDYGVFVLNYEDLKDRESTVAAAQSLISYLDSKLSQGYAQPIFILSHMPLNYSMRVYSGWYPPAAEIIFDVLNAAGAKGLNLFFLFGHNHSGWDHYLGGSNIYLAKGDTIQISKLDNLTDYKTYTLNFTYLNAGYVGYFDPVGIDGVDATLSMTKIEITGSDVTFTRYSADGVHVMKAAGVKDTLRGESYEPDTTVYNSPQTVALTQVSDSSELITTQIVSCSLSLNGVLGVNIKVDSLLADVTGYTVEATVDGRQTQILDTCYSEDGLFVYTADLMTHDVHKDIQIVLKNGDEIIQQGVFSFDSYHQALSTMYPEDTSLLALLESLSNYGSYGAYYADNTVELTPVEAVEAVTQSDLADYKQTVTANSSDLGTVAALYLDVACDLRIKFNTAAFEGCTLTVNGQQIDSGVLYESDQYTVWTAIELIPQRWSEFYEVVITNDSGELLNMHYSVLSYIYSCLGNATELKTGLNGLLKAMYLYQIAVSEYVAASGNGTPVTSWEELNGQSGTYYLTGDITGNATTVSGFTGTLNGMGYSVETSVPLFEILSGATVNDLNIILTADITATSDNGTGALACYTKSSTNITNVSVSGDYAVQPASGPAGGLVGKADDTYFTDCSNAVTVTGTGHAGGIAGRTGGATVGATFLNCANTGNITTTGEAYAGGLFGYTSGGKVVVTDCKNEGAVTAGIIHSNHNAGGAFGRIQGGAVAEITGFTNSGTITGYRSGGIGAFAHGSTADIENCTNTGTIVGPETDDFNADNGGIIGRVDASSTVNVTSCVNNGKVTGSMTAGIVAMCWSSTINLIGDTNYGTIVAYGQDAAGIAGRIQNGSTALIRDCSNYGTIVGQQNVQQLNSYAHTADGTVVTWEGSNLQLGTTTDELVEEQPGSGDGITSLSEITDLTGSYVLGGNITGNTVTVSGFTGTLDGNGYSIETSVPLFDILSGATVKNLEIVLTADITATSDYGTGALAYYAVEAVITNVDVSGACAIVPASGNAGGLVGKADNAQFTDCDNKAPVTGTAYVGGISGIVGGGSGTTFANCTNSGDITTTGANAGGIVGRNDWATGVVITGCTNTGDITAASEGAGGIVGMAAFSTDNQIVNCRNEGTVKNTNTSEGIAGGIAGQITHNTTMTVSGCTNAGSIIGAESTSFNCIAGGIVGRTYASGTVTVENCTNDGSISGGMTAGIVGMVWESPVTLIGNTNNGSVLAYGQDASGIVGRIQQNSTVLIEDCINNATITGPQNVNQYNSYCHGSTLNWAGINEANGEIVIA